jgi:potassium efflux system protein
MSRSPLKFSLRPTASSACIALLLALGIAHPISARAAAAAAKTESSVVSSEQKIEVISPPDVPDRADADERFIQAVVRRSQLADPKARFEQTLVSLSSGLTRLAEEARDTPVSTLSLRTLASLLRHWQFYERRISQWHVELQRIIKSSLEDETGISTRRALWQATATQLAASDSAPALLQRVDELIDHLDQANKAMSQSLAQTLDLGQRGSALLAQVEFGKAEVLNGIAEQDRRLLMIDSPPLWQAVSGSESRESVSVSLRKSLQIDWAFERDYDGAHIKQTRVGIACGLLLLPLMLWLRNQARRMITAGKTTALSMHVLLRPWTAWLVLIALGIALLGSRGPLIRQEAAILLAWIPVLRLLPPQVVKLIGPWVYLSSACYLLNVVDSLLVGNEIWYRYLLLIIDFLALASLAWLRARERRSAPVSGAASSNAVLKFLLVVAAPLLLASIGSNLLGNVSLATMLTGALLDSNYIALALYAGATVLVALFRMLFPPPRESSSSLHHAASLAQAGARAGRTMLIAAWLVYALQEFRIYRPLLDFLVVVFSYRVKLGVLSISLGSTAGFVATAWAAFWLAKTLRMILAEDILPSVSLPRGLGNTISTLAYYAILFLGLLAALAIAGFQVGELAIVFGALGVGIGFGLQDVVKNFVSGLILMFERPIQPGDIVDVAGTSGTVRDIGIRATILTTAEGAEVVVPNGMLLADKLVNWTLRSHRRRIEVNIVTTYGADPQRTMDLLVSIAAQVEGIAPAPPPMAVLTGLATGALEFTLRAWTTEQADWVIALSLLNLKVRGALAEAGIEVPLPQRDLHLRSVAKAAAQEWTEVIQPGSVVG